MLVDIKKFEEIYDREQAIFDKLVEPDPHWYQQKYVLQVLKDVGTTFSKQPKEAIVTEKVSDTSEKKTIKRQGKPKVEEKAPMTKTSKDEEDNSDKK